MQPELQPAAWTSIQNRRQFDILDSCDIIVRLPSTSIRGVMTAWMYKLHHFEPRLLLQFGQKK